MQHTMCCKNNKSKNKNNNHNNNNNNNNNKSNNNNNNNNNINNNNNKNKNKQERIWAVRELRSCIQNVDSGAITHMSFAIAEKPRLPRRIFPLIAMCRLDSLSAFSVCDSIYEPPCLTLVLCERMFAICRPLSRYPQHFALLWGLD